MVSVLTCCCRTNRLDVDLVCSRTGATSITYSFTADKGNSVPSWGSVDSANNQLVFRPPFVTADTSYSFTLAEHAAGDVNTYYVAVSVQVDGCTASSCSVCKAGDPAKCAV